jgi:hypothetical protein
MKLFEEEKELEQFEETGEIPQDYKLRQKLTDRR